MHCSMRVSSDTQHTQWQQQGPISLMSTGGPCNWCLLDVITVTCVKKREIQVPGRPRLLIIEACQQA